MNLLALLALASLLYADDAPKPTIEQLQAQLAQATADIAALRAYLGESEPYRLKLTAALVGCLGEIPRVPQPRPPIKPVLP